MAYMTESDLRTTLNLPKTDFPMKANLPQAEPQRLAHWKQEDLYGQLRKARAGRAALRAARRAALRQRPHPPGHRAQQDPEGRRRAQPHDGRLRRALRPGLGLPRPADRAQGRARTWARRSARCRRWRSARPAARTPRSSCDIQRDGVRAARRPGRVGRSLPDDGARRTRPRSCASSPIFAEKGLVYKAKKSVHWCISCRTALAEAEVEYDENHESPQIDVRFALADAEARPRSQARIPAPRGQERRSRSSGPRRPGRCRPTSRSPSTPRPTTASTRSRARGDVLLVAKALQDARPLAEALAGAQRSARRSPR